MLSKKANKAQERIYKSLQDRIKSLTIREILSPLTAHAYPHE
jgi:hypothetical protein